MPGRFSRPASCSSGSRQPVQPCFQEHSQQITAAARTHLWRELAHAAPNVLHQHPHLAARAGAWKAAAGTHRPTATDEWECTAVIQHAQTADP